MRPPLAAALAAALGAGGCGSGGAAAAAPDYRAARERQCTCACADEACRAACRAEPSAPDCAASCDDELDPAACRTHCAAWSDCLGRADDCAEVAACGPPEPPPVQVVSDGGAVPDGAGAGRPDGGDPCAAVCACLAAPEEQPACRDQCRAEVDGCESCRRLISDPACRSACDAFDPSGRCPAADNAGPCRELCACLAIEPGQRTACEQECHGAIADRATCQAEVRVDECRDLCAAFSP